MVLILLMCMTTMSLFTFLSQKNLNESLEKMYKNESESILKNTLLSIEYQLSTVEDTLEQLHQSLLLLNKYSINKDEIATLIQVQQDIFPINGQIIYGLENGDYFQGGVHKTAENYDPIEQDWYRLALEHPNEVFWTEPYFNFTTQEIIITASKSIIGHEGILGVIAIDFESSRNE